ncbi:MAG: ABC transporter permease, partial [Myxococcota bacterium]
RKPISSQAVPPRVGGVTAFVGRVGRLGLDILRFWSEAGVTLLDAVGSALAPGRAAARTVRNVAFRQVYFTGVQGLPAVTITALILGATLILQTRVVAPGIPGEFVGKLIVAVMLRELAPLTTAIIVASRSGTAIATELGNMRANLEVVGLASMGIDPARYVVQPRMVGTVVGVLVLTVYFCVLAVAGSLLTAALLSGGPNIDGVQHGIADTLGPTDLLLYLVKAGGCGIIVGWLCCHFGLQVKNSITEVPLMSGRAVIRSILGCVLYSFAVTVSYYAVASGAFELPTVLPV